MRLQRVCSGPSLDSGHDRVTLHRPGSVPPQSEMNAELAGHQSEPFDSIQIQGPVAELPGERMTAQRCYCLATLTV